MVGLHLFPGVLIALGYLALAFLLAPTGAPANLALLLSFALLAIPIELGFLLYRARRPPGVGSLGKVVGFREPLPRRAYLLLVPPLLVWSVLAYTLLAPAAEALRQGAFGWWPTQLSLAGLAQDPGHFQRPVVWLIVGLSLVLNVAGPVVEELYFRGYLLPRMGRFGYWAPLINTALFSLYHFWLPWEFLSRLAALLPTFYVVWWKRNIAIGIWVHVLLNSLGSLGLLALVLAQGAS
jgi:membrane protease YdiL (CAAX protease family)